MISFQACKDAIEQLTDLGNRIWDLETPTTPKPHASYRYIDAVMISTKALLITLANTFPNEDKFNLNYSDKGTSILIGSINRSFLSDIHGATEEALIAICKERGIMVESTQKKQIEDILQKIEQETGHNQLVKKHTDKLRKKTRSIRPSLMDYVNVLLERSSLTKENQKTWRKFFEALTIIRNKVNHGNFKIEALERKKLIEGGFAQSVKVSGDLKVGPRYYPQISGYILDFLDSVSV